MAMGPVFFRSEEVSKKNGKERERAPVAPAFPWRFRWLGSRRTLSAGSGGARRAFFPLAPVLALLLLGLAGPRGPWSAAASAAEDSSIPTVEWAKLRGSINPASASFLEASIRQAEGSGAQALVVELDTPGGLITSVRSMTQAIEGSRVPVVVYVSPAGASATSAGALLSLGSHVVAMAPGTSIGAAHPVDSSGKEIPGAVGEKAVNDTAAFARGLAELRGRDPALAEQIVSKSKSLSSGEAFERKLAEFIAGDSTELLEKLDGKSVPGFERPLRTRGARIVESRMTLGQRILHFLADPNVATLLISFGLLLLYVEITTPGIQIAGALGLVLLLTGFMTFQLLPIRTGGFLLLLLGVALLVAELFATAHGVLAVGGAVAFVLGLLWLMDPGATASVVSPAVWVPAGILLALLGLLLAWVATRGRELVARARRAIGGEGELGLRGYLAHVESVNASGRGGKAQIRGETWDFVLAEGVAGPLRAGELVMVEATRGFVVVVRPVPPGGEAASTTLDSRPVD